ncbi:MAG TPA: CapA family protein, partial [Nitrospirota bacterium]
IIDWGADLILGHHPHVMQGIEIYKGKVIAYSLGNFVFDQKGNWTDKSFLLACRFREKTLYAAEIIPLDRFRTYFPRVAEGKTRTDILEELKKISLPINSDPQQLSRVGLTISQPAVTP